MGPPLSENNPQDPAQALRESLGALRSVTTTGVAPETSLASMLKTRQSIEAHTETVDAPTTGPFEPDSAEAWTGGSAAPDGWEAVPEAEAARTTPVVEASKPDAVTATEDDADGGPGFLVWLGAAALVAVIGLVLWTQVGGGTETRTEANQPVEMGPSEVEPAVEQPVGEDPVAEEPVVEQPVVEDPVVEDPVVEEPVVEVPPTTVGTTTTSVVSDGALVLDGVAPDQATIDALVERAELVLGPGNVTSNMVVVDGAPAPDLTSIQVVGTSDSIENFTALIEQSGELLDTFGSARLSVVATPGAEALRANAVVDFYVDSGVDASRLETLISPQAPRDTLIFVVDGLVPAG